MVTRLLCTAPRAISKSLKTIGFCTMFSYPSDSRREPRAGLGDSGRLSVREPWEGATGVPCGNGLVLGTTCKDLGELLGVGWAALGVVGRALGGSSGGPWWSLGFSAQLPGQFQNR